MPNLAREIIEIQPTIAFQATKMRVAAYARVSSDSEDQLSSFESQVTYYSKFINQNEDWDFVEVFADEGISGVSLNKRDEFHRMLELCRDGKIDRIITKSTSRFARNTVDSITTLRELKLLGVSVFFEKEGIDTAKISGENLITLYSLFAQEESQTISRNCKRGIRMRMENGTYSPCTAPYGYRLQERKLVVQENEAEIVQRIFCEYLLGSGTTEIAESLNQDNIPWNKGDNLWKRKTVSVIIKNERYKGDSLWQKTFSEDVVPYKKKNNHGELPQFYQIGSHQGIISPIQFELANVLMKERGDKIVVKQHEFPLSQKIRCSECGSVYRYRKTREKIYWVCRIHDENAENCKGQRIREDDIYRAFVTLYNKLRSNYKEILLPFASHLEKLQEMGERENKELKELNQRIAHIAEENLTVTGLMSSGILDSSLFIAQKDALTKQMEQVKREKKRLLQKLKKDDTLEKTEELIDFFETAPEQITDFSPELFEEIVEIVYAHDKESVEFVLINGVKLKERL